MSLWQPTEEEVKAVCRSEELYVNDPMYQPSMDKMYTNWLQPKYDEARRNYEEALELKQRRR